ncbi:MAG: AMP-binding protein, partial [Syntrophaceae bacterium]
MAQTGLVKGQQYEFQLNIKDLLTSPRFSAGKQEIVYRDKMRYTYRDLFERINRLGSALNRLGVKKGDTVA